MSWQLLTDFLQTSAIVVAWVLIVRERCERRARARAICERIFDYGPSVQVWTRCRTCGVKVEDDDHAHICESDLTSEARSDRL